MKRLVILSSALALAACGGSDTSGTFETEDGGTGTYSVEGDGDEGTVSIKMDDGEFHMNIGSDGEVDYVEGLSGYPGMNVISTTNVTHEDGRNASVTFMTDDQPDEVVEFYRKKAEAGGFDINSEIKMNDSRIIGGEAEDGRSFSLNVNPSDEGGSMVNLGFSEK